MASCHRKLLKRATVLSLGLAIFGTEAMAQTFTGRRILPENIVGINILAAETNYIVNLPLCGAGNTYLHVGTTNPIHNRVFTAWNTAVLTGQPMDVWGTCRTSTTTPKHADLLFLGVNK